MSGWCRKKKKVGVDSKVYIGIEGTIMDIERQGLCVTQSQRVCDKGIVVTVQVQGECKTLWSTKHCINRMLFLHEANRLRKTRIQIIVLIKPL